MQMNALVEGIVDVGKVIFENALVIIDRCLWKMSAKIIRHKSCN